LAPLLIWTVLFFITFYVMCITDFYFLVLLLFLEVLCIIFELNQSWGTVVRIEKNTKLKFKYKFKGMEAYHIKARRNKDISNLYMVKDVLKKVTDDRLEKNKGRVQETGYY